MYPLQFICLYIDGGYEIGENFENHILQLAQEAKKTYHETLSTYISSKHICIYIAMYEVYISIAESFRAFIKHKDVASRHWDICYRYTI